MTRLPGDWSRWLDPKPDGPRPERPARRERRRGRAGPDADPLTVSELSGLIKSTLEERVAAPLRVVGQVSNLATPNHWYFSLKDEQAVIGCVAWASSVRKFGFTPRDGDEVIAVGHVSHYAPQGRTQFYVSRLEPVGAGALQLRFQAMCAELRELGYFDEARKKTLPVFPRRIAVITSAEGAAVHDVVSTAAQRCPAVGLVVVNVRVQGEGAAEAVAKAIRWVDAGRERLGVDAVIVTRGGGSIEDLWAFNERVVADAALECSLPLVAAIGHESDTTVVELVADRRAATPTQATMLLVPAAEAMRRQVDHLRDRLHALLRRRLEHARQRVLALADREIFRRPHQRIERERRRVEVLDRMLARGLAARLAEARAGLERAAARLARVQPHRLLARRQERLAVLEDRLRRATAALVRRQRPTVDARVRRLDLALALHVRRAAERLRALEREFGAVDPRQVLRRGFSFTTTARGEIIRHVSDVHARQRIVTHVVDGSFGSVVSGSGSGGSGEDADDTREQMDLFGSNE